MADNIIGRKKEQEQLWKCYHSGRPEFIAVYGRRRVGKTFLVKHVFEKNIDFYMTGIYQGSRQDHLALFQKQINQYADSIYPPVHTWDEAFEQLKHYLSNLQKERIVVFLDELPWMDVPRSKFLQAFSVFWNMYGSDNNRLMLIVCGSATTWMTSQLIGNTGGLYNRLTQNIYLEPFTLAETQQFFDSRNIGWEKKQTIDFYMAAGGIPYYLSLVQPGLSVAQNIDRLFFAPHAPLQQEYEFLFRSLFKDAAIYQRVVELLSRKAKGMTREEIKQSLKLKDGGMLSTVLSNLRTCDFIRKYRAFGKKERDVLYQLCDFYTLFYLRFVKSHGGDEHLWSHSTDDPARRAWSGYAFEQVCLQHIRQIKQALGISGVQTNTCSWVSREPEHGAQIDLLIERRDDVVNVCEVKYAAAPYAVSKEYYLQLMNRIALFRSQTGTRKALVLTMITTYGLKPGGYASSVPLSLTFDDLFGS